jgi:TolB protein
MISKKIVKINLFSLSVLLILLALLRQGDGANDVHLGVTRVEVPKISILISQFTPQGASSVPLSYLTQGREILKQDLDWSGIFEVLEGDFLPPEMQGSSLNPGQELMARLNLQRVQTLVVGGLGLKGQDLFFEGRLYDVTGGQMVVGKRYYGRPDQLRRMIHRFADEITYRLTGEQGIAKTRIVYMSNETGYKEIYAMDYDGYNLIAVTRNHSLNVSPRWLPDGKSLAYTSFRDNNPDLFVVSLETSKRLKTFGFPGLNLAPAWSPDGKTMAISLSKDGNTSIYLANADGSGLRRITDDLGIYVTPTWSPNSRQIAFTSDRGGSPQIWVMDAEGTNLQRLTSGGNNTAPRWSPKGDKIAFVSRLDGHFQICIMNPDGTEAQQLTNSPGNNESPSWAADGRHIVFSSNREGKAQLYIMNANGTGQRKIGSGKGECFSPDWSPN